MNHNHTRFYDKGDSSPSTSLLREALLSPSTTQEQQQQQQQQHDSSDLSSAYNSVVSSSPSRSFIERIGYTSLNFHSDSEEDDADDVEHDDDDEQEVVVVDGTEQPHRVPMELLSHRLNPFMAGYHRWILGVIVLILWPLGVVSFHAFQQGTDSTFHPIPGSSSAMAQEAFQKTYAPRNDYQNPLHPPLILVLENTSHPYHGNGTYDSTSFTDPTSPLYTAARDYALGLQPFLHQQCWTDTGRIPDCTSDKNYRKQSPWLKVTSYYSLQQDGLSTIAEALCVADLTIIELQYILPDNFHGDEKKLCFALMDVIDEYTSFKQRQHPNATSLFSVNYTGIHYFQRDLVESTKADIRRMDLFALPLALLLMGLVLPAANAWVVWIVPTVSLITTCCAWSIVMRFVVQGMQITQFTPTVMMSLSLGMGVDASLFLLARYVGHPEVFTNRSAAVLYMWTKGGHVVIVSGVTLLCTFLGLLFLPLQMLKSVGVGSAVAIACAILSNLIVVPALLYTRIGTWIVLRQSSTSSQEQHPATQYWLVESDNDSLLPQDIDANHKMPSIWLWLAKQLLHPYKGIAIFVTVCACLIPVGWQSTKLQSSIAFDLLLPSDSPSMQTYQRLGDTVGPGRLHPYRILFDGSHVDLKMTSARGFAIMNHVVRELRAIGNDLEDSTTLLTSETSSEQIDRLAESLRTISNPPKVTKFTGISVLENHENSHGTYTAAKICCRTMTHCPIELFRLIDALDKSATSENDMATYVTATLPVNPFSDNGLKWLRAARAKIEDLSKDLDGVQLFLQGIPAVGDDAVTAVFDAFPGMIVLTILIVFALTGFFFRSVLTTCRSVVGTMLTVSFSYGLGVLVYQNGILDWTNIKSLESLDDNFSWLVPIMTFSIMVGLALDYDAFLMSRILEFRLEGLDHSASIAAGLHETGGIITAAGGIMAVAFGSLLFSSSPVLFQWSFILTTAVLLDTVVIRTVVVPVITCFAGELFWWPRKLPRAYYHLACFLQTPNDIAQDLSNSPDESVSLRIFGTETSMQSGLNAT